jgi:bacterioferritin (cytochrome b1)
MLILKQFLEAQVELSNENDIISAQLSTQEKQIYELKQQLRDLTTIEQNIQQRDKAVETGDVQ